MTAPREFYDPTERSLGDPALDPPLTVRVRGGQDRAVRYSADAVRAVKVSSAGRDVWPWVIVAGDVQSVGEWLTDRQVADWPVVPDCVNGAAFDLARDVAQAWAGFRAASALPVDDPESFPRFTATWQACAEALDRLAAAYGTEP